MTDNTQSQAELWECLLGDVEDAQFSGVGLGDMSDQPVLPGS